ncbi:MFS general substrate transporter [Aspergillus campestris IBT 28561]|uniref:MFS general substrate transporter n=1 Tax=Aspergillus campestris (strain IBT 28561) TaxID=1392248 RepID=A0A2I1CRB3_ASPC2|nr:MFS general substrate transporter [Aspergillus campestris IBT 28561]PKY00149.1 MFS general substrate transporter [Aspergillus campestris IBT 28561]
MALTTISLWRMVFDQGAVTHDVLHHQYPGTGTDDDPYQVSWVPNDPRNPLEFRTGPRWAICGLASIATLTVALGSSTYSGGTEQIREEFHTNQEVTLLGISMWVLGFALGPMVWAPLSEVYGRRPISILSALGLTIFTTGSVGAKNIQTLVILRFFAGSLGSSPMAVSGSIIADTFPPIVRGLGSNIYAVAAFIGPALGPIIGSYLASAAGWRWDQGLLAIAAGILLFTNVICLPETYAPVLLHARAARLSALTGQHYTPLSPTNNNNNTISLKSKLQTALARPFSLLIHEPIVLFLSLYSAIIYGILYLFFAAYPIVFHSNSLPFLAILIGNIISIALTIPTFYSYRRRSLASPTPLPPETRLPPSFPGCILLPISLFWFAFTANNTENNPMVTAAAGLPFGFAIVSVYMPILSYLIDTYGPRYAASAIAVNALLRSLFGAVFPLFTPVMYARLGVTWASTVPAFLALACVPLPFVFWTFGKRVRRRCRFAVGGRKSG